MSDRRVFQGEIVDRGGENGTRRPPLGDLSREQRQERLKEYLLLGPRLIKLVLRLMRDPRVPPRTKAMMLVVGGYLVFPIDVIPDFIPGVGHFDDLLVAAFALDQIINRVPEEVVLEHWEGDEDVLQVVREILDISTGFMPPWIRKRFARR
ncbi:MAG: YkvA family protein [Actinomycetota bacterium]